MFSFVFPRPLTTFLLINLLLLSSVLPLVAAPKRVRTTPSKPIQKLNAPHRDGELLVRFHAGVSKHG